MARLEATRARVTEARTRRASAPQPAEKPSGPTLNIRLGELEPFAIQARIPASEVARIFTPDFARQRMEQHQEVEKALEGNKSPTATLLSDLLHHTDIRDDSGMPEGTNRWTDDTFTQLRSVLIDARTAKSDSAEFALAKTAAFVLSNAALQLIAINPNADEGSSDQRAKALAESHATDIVRGLQFAFGQTSVAAMGNEIAIENNRPDRVFEAADAVREHIPQDVAGDFSYATELAIKYLVDGTPVSGEDAKWAQRINNLPENLADVFAEMDYDDGAVNNPLINLVNLSERARLIAGLFTNHTPEEQAELQALFLQHEQAEQELLLATTDVQKTAKQAEIDDILAVTKDLAAVGSLEYLQSGNTIEAFGTPFDIIEELLQPIIPQDETSAYSPVQRAFDHARNALAEGSLQSAETINDDQFTLTETGLIAENKGAESVYLMLSMLEDLQQRQEDGSSAATRTLQGVGERANIIAIALSVAGLIDSGARAEFIDATVESERNQHLGQDDTAEQKRVLALLPKSTTRR